MEINHRAYLLLLAAYMLFGHIGCGVAAVFLLLVLSIPDRWLLRSKCYCGRDKTHITCCWNKGSK